MSPTGEDDLAGIERERLRVLVEVDLDRARALHADDFQLVMHERRDGRWQVVWSQATRILD